MKNTNPRKNSQKKGWLAHLARHAPRNSRVKYAVGSISPYQSVVDNKIENAVYI